MQFLKSLFLRITTERDFYYNWEQRAFERRQEQLFSSDRSTGQVTAQFTCRFGRD